MEIDASKLKIGWNEIGKVGVDTGRITIHDPCYNKEQQKRLGFVIPTGFGDGLYPVDVRVKNYGTKEKPDKRIIAVFVYMER